ncbi:MAG: substrate-binding domain-containing protein [Prevotella sp.]|nr:substrate-binding domain-containing protein [Prevotella sp.]MDE6012476.1 substrate-binding domain-containing protein [Prevotella sp.]MDE6688525.1 substrate-binding domain-containing protein [Prevotella sp.]
MNIQQFRNLFIGLTLITGLFPSCGGNRPSDNAYKEAARYFAADESLSPIINEELDIFLMKSKRDSIYPLYISEQEAIEKLMNQEVFLVFTTRSLTPNEENTLKQLQYRPRIITLAYDALALIVNKNNPDTLINVDNFRKIMSGEVTKWNELYPDSRLGDIKVAFDNPKSSTVRYVVDSIMNGTELKTDGNVRAAMTSAEVVEYVESHENAIGVVGSIWLNDQRDTTNLTYNRNITVMKVGKSQEITRDNTYKPSQWNIAYAYYPFIRTIYALCIDPRSDGVPRAFANFCWLPNPGQLIFFNAGLFPGRADYSVRDVIIH